MQFLANDVPPRLYKYLRPIHADEMIQSGKIRIGSLHSYRAMEIPDPERIDSGEGTAAVTIGPGSRLGSELPTSFHQFASGMKLHPAARLQVKGGGSFRMLRDPPNAFLYCMCVIFERGLTAAFGGACVEIYDPAAFLRLVATSLAGPDELGVAWAARGYTGHCQYGLREQEIAAFSAVDPYLAKPAMYDHQQEFRAIWMPTRIALPRYLDRAIGCLEGICRRMT